MNISKRNKTLYANENIFLVYLIKNVGNAIIF